MRVGLKCWALLTGRYDRALGAHADSDLAGKMRSEQVRGVLRVLSFITLAQAMNALAFIAATYDVASPSRLVGWAIMLSCAYVLVLAPRVANIGAPRPSRASAGAIARMNRNAFMLGLAWGALPVMFFAEATVGAKILIACICAGTMGAAGFVYAAVPSAAVATIAPIALGSICALARLGGPEAGWSIFLVCVFCVALVRGALGHTLDLMRRFAAQADIESLTRRDNLTELDNRAAFRGSVTEALLRLERSVEPCAIFLVDIDDLKRVNEARDHSFGDAALIETARRLRILARPQDKLARYESDQFAILAPGLTGETTLRAYARRIVEAFREPMSIRGARFDLTVCVGAYSAQDASIGYETVIRNAELALRKAQSHGSGSAHVFGPRDDAAEMERKALQTDLRFALERRELSLAYQPMLCLRTGKINGFEALLRWKHPTRGEISPAVFIPLAEETGAIEAIGAFVIRQACAAAARWPETIRVCLNVSAHQLRSRALCDLVEAALRDAEIPSSRLEIEITESVLIGDDRLAHGILTDLRKSGVRLALDDFGTGYSSLSYLRRLPFDRIKIDRSFVVGIVEDAGSAAIVKSIIGLADDLGMEIIAEGIETREQLDALRKLGCPEVQGYLIGKPMPGENVRGFLEASARRHAA